MAGFMAGIGNIHAGQIMGRGAANAALTQTQYGLSGLNTGNTVYNKGQEMLDPYMKTGAQANEQLQLGMGQSGSLGRAFTMADFNQDPAYRANLEAGKAAILNSNSVRGGALSGGTLKALSNYGQQQANNSFETANARFVNNQNQNFGQLSSLAGLGLNATNQATNLGANWSNAQMGQKNTIGNASAAGFIGEAKGEAQAAQGFWSSVGSIVGS